MFPLALLIAPFGVLNCTVQLLLPFKRVRVEKPIGGALAFVDRDFIETGEILRAIVTVVPEVLTGNYGSRAGLAEDRCRGRIERRDNRLAE